MTRGEAPGGSRPGVFDAIHPAGGWMGDRYSPSWRERSPPSARPHRRRAQKPVGNRQRHSWGWLAVSTGERRRKLRLSYFLSPAQKRVSALLGETFLHYHPHMDGGDNVAVGAIITLSPTHSRRTRKGRMPSPPYPSCGRMPNEERRERDDDRRSREPRDRWQALRSRAVALLRRKRSCSRS